MGRNKGYIIENHDEIRADSIESMNVFGKSRKPINHKYLLKQSRIENYMREGRHSIDDVRKQIQNKTCQLSSELRKFFLTEYREFKGD